MKSQNLIFFLVVKLCFGARILLLTPLGSRSHKIAYMPVAEGLAKKGHNVTVVSIFKDSRKIPNLRDYVVANGTALDASILKNFDDLFEENSNSRFYSAAMKQVVTACNDFLALDDVQALKKEKFDMVILSMVVSECFASFLHDFKVPSVLIFPGTLIGPYYDTTGQLYLPSIAGLESLTSAMYPYSFLERMKATLATDYAYFAFKYNLLPDILKICKERKLCSEDMPPMIDLFRNASLIMINSVRALEIPPKPYFPNVVFMGGVNCKPGKPLSTELEEWIQGAGEDGFIFFSLGTNVKPSKLPERMRKTFINVFGSLKQRVLWKWDAEMDDVPPNVRIGKWFPQQDILAHTKLKLFISHGGLLSTFEATYHGIPILGMPVFADQFANINKAEKEGWAVKLLWKELSEENLKSKITSVIQSKEMKRIITERAAVMKDFPRSPKEEAVYWIEYVLRHNGAKHLRSPVHDLSKFNLYNIDVRLTIIGLSILLVGGFFYVIFKLIKLCCCNFKNSSKKKRKAE